MKRLRRSGDEEGAGSDAGEQRCVWGPCWEERLEKLNCHIFITLVKTNEEVSFNVVFSFLWEIL